MTLDNVAKDFDGQPAVLPLELTIDEGEFITLLGPSGCGKTTLLRMIAGFENPSLGRILLDQRDITPLPPERRPFNMMFQSYALFPHLNVFDNVAYGLRTAGLREPNVRGKVMAALELVGLESHAGRPVDQLSGGMSQRVALVRAIVNEPRMLLLDEPLGALDLQLRKRMQVELRSIQERIGTTFIHVTHDQEEALVMSHRVVLMQHGRVVQVGPPRDVYEHPHSRFAAEFIGEASMIPCRIEAVRDRTVDVVLCTGARASFASYQPGGPPLSGEGLIALRPKHLRLEPAGNGLFQGEVRDVIYVGTTSDVVVHVGGGETLRVQAGDENLPRRGAAVGVAVQPGTGAFVPIEESAIDPDDYQQLQTEKERRDG